MTGFQGREYAPTVSLDWTGLVEMGDPGLFVWRFAGEKLGGYYDAATVVVLYSSTMHAFC